MSNYNTALARPASPLADENPAYEWCRRNQSKEIIENPPQPANNSPEQISRDGLFPRHLSSEYALGLPFEFLTLLEPYWKIALAQERDHDDWSDTEKTSPHHQYYSSTGISLRIALECLEPIIRFLPSTPIRPFLGVLGAFLQPSFQSCFFKNPSNSPIFVQHWLATFRAGCQYLYLAHSLALGSTN